MKVNPFSQVIGATDVEDALVSVAKNIDVRFSFRIIHADILLPLHSAWK